MRLPIVSCAEMRRIEEAAFAAGATAEELMEKVGRQVAQAVQQWDISPQAATVFYGKGHNGGDALVAARHLADAGWEIELRAQEDDEGELAPLTAAKLREVQGRKVKPWAGRGQVRSPECVVLDGLLGIGAAGPLREDVRALTREINWMREDRNARVFAIDLPTGLDGDTGEADADCVIADATVTAGYAKRGLVADAATRYVGRLCVAALEEFEPHAPAGIEEETATPESLKRLLKRRNFDSYKNQYGRVGIVAGSVGFTGAAALCANGALRAGAGLVTVYAPAEIQAVVAAIAPEEVMVRLVRDYSEVLADTHDVLAVGPGLGKGRAAEVLQVILDAECPMVLDADGLNIVAERGTELLSRCAGPRLLTPHPGEMARLFPELKEMARAEAARRFTERFGGGRHPLALLLKGARTVIHERGRPLSYNTTGNPGMGTGGMGDVLTGVGAALIGQGLALYDAARLGAWVCGRAAELATWARAEESLAALDLMEFMGMAFQALREGGL